MAVPGFRKIQCSWRKKNCLKLNAKVTLQTVFLAVIDAKKRRGKILHFLPNLLPYYRESELGTTMATVGTRNDTVKLQNMVVRTAEMIGHPTVALHNPMPPMVCRNFQFNTSMCVTIES